MTELAFSVFARGRQPPPTSSRDPPLGGRSPPGRPSFSEWVNLIIVQSMLVKYPPTDKTKSTAQSDARKHSLTRLNQRYYVMRDCSSDMVLEDPSGCRSPLPINRISIHFPDLRAMHMIGSE